MRPELSGWVLRYGARKSEKPLVCLNWIGYYEDMATHMLIGFKLGATRELHTGTKEECEAVAQWREETGWKNLRIIEIR